MHTNPAHSPTRRQLIGAATAAAAALPLVAARSAPAQELLKSPAPESSRPDPWRGLKAGVATYSLRGMKVEDAIVAIQRVDLKYASIKDVHLRLDAHPSWKLAVTRKFKEAGITPISCGVINMTGDEAEIRKAFEYARDINVPTIVCSPDPASMETLDKLVKEFDIKLAIHNHGPGDKKYPSPYDAMKLAEKFDERIGVCIDVGHTARAGVDPAESIRKCAERLYDVHLKDVANPKQRGPEVELGRGDLDVSAMLQALQDIKYAHHVGFEHEKHPKDPVPGLAESVGYAKGLMRSRQ